MLNMNNEEFERKMAFIVEQQAVFASDIQRLQESQSRTEKSVDKLAGFLSEVGEALVRLANYTIAGFTEVNAKIDALVDAQIRTEANIARTEANIARTEGNLALTDEKLRKLITVVDRHISEGRKDGD